MPLGLEADAWLYAAAVAFVLGHLAVLGLLVRRSARSTSPPVGQPAQGVDGAGEDPVPGRAGERSPDDLPPVGEDTVVRCPHCSVRNAVSFRFCRYCVGELTGGATVSDAGGASKDGQAF